MREGMVIPFFNKKAAQNLINQVIIPVPGSAAWPPSILLKPIRFNPAHSQRRRTCLRIAAA
jgi:hypothetical protein